MNLKCVFIFVLDLLIIPGKKLLKQRVPKNSLKDKRNYHHVYGKKKKNRNLKV